MEFSLPAVLADLADPLGNQEDMEVLLLRRADVTRSAPDVLSGGSDLGDQQATDAVRTDRALQGAFTHLGDGHRAEARHREPPERFSFGWAQLVSRQGLRHDLSSTLTARADPGTGDVPAVPPPGPVEHGRHRLSAAAGGWFTWWVRYRFGGHGAPSGLSPGRPGRHSYMFRTCIFMYSTCTCQGLQGPERAS